MLLLSAADVAERHLDAAVARLDERPGLREAFETERHEVRPDRRTLYFDAASGWRFVDLCDVCGSDLGYLEQAATLSALCEECDEEHEAAWGTDDATDDATDGGPGDGRVAHELAALDPADGYADLLGEEPALPARRRAG